MENIITPCRPDYKTLTQMIRNLISAYPSLSCRVIGKSVMGRGIYALSLGSGPRRALITAAFHAQEWLTALVALKFTEELCEAIGSGGSLAGIDISRALFGRTVTVIPMMNPDGAELALHGIAAAGELTPFIYNLTGGDLSGWNANANGVDLNHNFDAGWDILRKAERGAGIFGPAKRRYGGEKPESEPETAALCGFCRTHSTAQAMALHSQGEEIYWRYGDKTPKRAEAMANILAAACKYTLSDPEGLASHGGFKDWFIQEFARPAFTVEMGRGENPLPLESFGGIYARLREMLVLFCAM